MRILPCFAASFAFTSAAQPALAQTPPGGKEALAILRKAVAVLTIAGRGQVSVLADKIKARLLAAGFALAGVKFTPVGETGYLNERLPLATLDPGVRQWETLLRAIAK